MTEEFVKARRTGATVGVLIHGFIYDLPRSQVAGDGWEVLTEPTESERQRVTEPAPSKPAKKKGKVK